MALQASGPISLADLAAEFADTAPYSMSEFYRDGGKVTGNNTNVPTSGAIGLGNFYNATRQIALTIASNQSNLNLRTWALANGWDGVAPLAVTLNTGVWISGSVAGNSTAALTIDGSFPGGVTFINNGTVAGRGGNGGAGASQAASATAGQAGGRAMLVSSAVSIQNNGTIAGGGGGGGGGASASRAVSCSMGETDCSSTSNGGGGGGGRSNAGFNASGGGVTTVSSNGCSTTAQATAGGTGTSAAPGGGGSNTSMLSICICPSCNSAGGDGGAGGAWGAAGGTGGVVSLGDTARSNAAGGAAGQAVSGDGNVTWQSLGTILGARV